MKETLDTVASGPRSTTKTPQVMLIRGLLVGLTLLVFAQTLRFEFLDWNDTHRVSENPIVQKGITAEGLLWAATTTEHAPYWHPLTWLSHMLDCELFGLNPAGHHLTNLLLHLASTLLLFGALNRATGMVWPSGLTAGLFALHPLHVECVAWIGARPDLLGTMFGFAAIRIYVEYALRGGAVRYSLVVLMLSLGLMSKPIVVTLPAILLLLDLWPLRRLRFAFNNKESDDEHVSAMRARSIRFLLMEKLPLLAVSLAAALITYFTVHPVDGSWGSSDLRDVQLPISLKLAHATASYGWYLVKTVWPTNLMVHYPHPYMPGNEPWGWPAVGGSAILLLAISAAVIKARRRGWPLVGWLWFLGALVPVIGLVQVRDQGVADRYTYFSLVGPFILIAFCGSEILARVSCCSSFRKAAGWIVSLVIVGLCMAASWRQTQHWRNSIRLFEHSLSIWPGNAIMRDSFGYALWKKGRTDDAKREFQEAIRIHPTFSTAHNNLARAHSLENNLKLAEHHYRESIKHNPRHPRAAYNLAVLLGRQKRYEESVEYFQMALPISGELPALHRLFAEALFQLNRVDEAIEQYQRALALNPADAFIHYRIGMCYLVTGQVAEAARSFREAERRWTDSHKLPKVLADMASKLATHPDSGATEAEEALRLAQRAVKLADGEDIPALLELILNIQSRLNLFRESKTLKIESKLERP
jgi:tetratricopeptide (TPR) repeat protein